MHKLYCSLVESSSKALKVPY